MIDLHCHFLPGIDDGAQTLAEALDLARAAVAAGIKTAVMTPHVHAGRYDNNLRSIKESFSAFEQALAVNGIPLEIRVGAEVRMTADLMSQVEADEIPYLGELDGYRIVLLEFPHGHLMVGADKLVQWLLARRIRPMIAHPERNKEVIRNFEKIYPFVAMGCLLQLTGASILGECGKPAQACAAALIEHNWATVVATDSHSLLHRPPNLDLARKALVSMGGESLARQLTQDAPAGIVRSQVLQAA